MGERLKRLLQRGVRAERSVQENTHTQRSNVMALLFVALTAPCCLLLFVCGFPFFGLLLCGVVVLYLTPLWLNPRGYYTIARVVPVASGALAVTLMTIGFGVELQIHLAPFLLACWPFQLFDVRREKLPLVVLVVLNLGLFIAVQAEVLPQLHLVAFDDATIYALRVGFSVVVAVAFATTLMLFYARNQKNELALQQSVLRLEEEVLQRSKVQNSLKLARDEAQQALKAKSEFLAMTSHELSTPLHGILGSVDLLEDELAGETNRETLGMLRQSSERFSKLLRGVMAFVRLGSSKAQLSTVACQPLQLVESVVLEFTSQAHAKGLQLDLHIRGNLSETLVGDPKLLRQAIASIVSNAICFTNEGSVWVEAAIHREHGRGHGHGPQVEVTVSDTGPGVSPDLKETLFQPFTQSVAMKYRGTDGIGLGLAICHKIALAMQGQITMNDRPGGGNVAHLAVYLEASETTTADNPRLIGLPVAADKSSAEELPAGRKQASVLIAEDNKISRRLVTRMMERLGYDVVATEDGHEAVDAWKRRRFDLILLDVQMPNLDGLDAARYMRACEKATAVGDASHQLTPIVILTANTSPEQETEAGIIGIQGYLNKPCRPDALRNTIAGLGLPTVRAANS